MARCHLVTALWRWWASRAFSTWYACITLTHTNGSNMITGTHTHSQAHTRPHNKEVVGVKGVFHMVCHVLYTLTGQIRLLANNLAHSQTHTHACLHNKEVVGVKGDFHMVRNVYITHTTGQMRLLAHTLAHKRTRTHGRTIKRWFAFFTRYALKYTHTQIYTHASTSIYRQQIQAHAYTIGHIRKQSIHAQTQAYSNLLNHPCHIRVRSKSA